VAARVRHAGIGLSASARLAGVGQLHGLLRRLLDEAPFSARLEALAQELAQAGGASAAADIVEQALASASTYPCAGGPPPVSACA
jgi:UDP:flavonoid glycosyltransferase YjiC (YdhE family)